ncbi:related to Cutinase transcription factor 1 alpha [Rhynchosporium graminicola]|uniref:Related to Cutinase transcription factor 1 alpha n=1 Tax=Rhynchosporium graminicola TaxID=2792576 RepID=A0A1E1KB05_9HELO|nr:related to Cutinase transcription factor 1 alpha [Rhynchosporium commune]
MAGEPGTRRLLPQSSQMQSFSFAPTNFGQRENQKNYVFVDEHNRHKRLKVMRACEGCRRRKIKCDAATTNTWPCSACIRLKLHCIPPTVNYDRDFPTNQGFEGDRAEYESGGSGDDDYQHQLAMQQHMGGPHKNIPPIYTQQMPYSDPASIYQSGGYGEPSSSHSQPSMHYSSIQTPNSIVDQHHIYPPQPSYSSIPLQRQQPQPHTPEAYEQDHYGEQNLADLLGELRMNEAGSAPYLNNKSKTKTMLEEPAFEDADAYKLALPTTLSGPDLKVRIPPELMPDDQTCMEYFNMYFMNVHPYVPVLNKSLFYQQWHTNRDSISPLILEAIFAIAGRLADEPSQGHQWLALASKHADSFMDVPRLSTLQGLLIVLKARESAPKRGYYYRSWMTVVQCVQMAKDLGLDEHFDEHKAGRPCGSDLADCIMKTRIWQTAFVCELMVGSPQGRTDLAVDMDTVDLGIPRSVVGNDEAEFHVTRNFTYFTKVILNVRRMNNVYAKIKKKKDWGIDPDFVQLNPSFESWMNDLPLDLQVTFSPDGSRPWIPSHFIGNLHSYYYLSIIMLHRPQLTFMEPTGMDGGWKHHMMICYSSAKLLCRLQESILDSFGLTGLLCMQRGINFTIYCILTCTVLHLVALTSPDPDLNTDAREYFTRHMRILEKCTSSWPMPDMQQQIDALREAFSADIRKPFVLKPSFPYASPSGSINSTPPRSIAQYRPQGPAQQALEQQHAPQQVSYTAHPISPPISAGGVDTKSDSPAVQSLVMMATGQRGSQPQPSTSTGVPMADPSTWNPSRIFDQWNTTFGTPPAQSTSAPPITPLRLPVSGAQEIPTLPELQNLPNSNLNPNSHPLPPQQYSGAAIPSFVSPSMWQESVASVYEGGLKRQHQWDYDESIVKRAR